MTEYNTGPDHRDPVQSNQAPATETDSPRRPGNTQLRDH